MKCEINQLVKQTVLVTGLILGSGASLFAQSEIQVSVVSPLDKIFHDTRLISDGEPVLTLESAANEFESGQFVIRSDRELRNVSVTVSELSHASGEARIAAANLEWRFVGYVPVERNTTEAECGEHLDIPPGELLRLAPFDCPDPLLEETSVTVPADTSQPVWITARVPKGTPPGLYRGTIGVQTSSGNVDLPIELTVFPFELPDERHLYLTNWFQGNHIAQAHGVELLSDEYWEILSRYARDFAEHHQNVIYTPWRLIKIFREADGRLTYDYSDFDRFVETFIEAGTAERIEIQHVAHHGEEGLQGNEILIYDVKPVDRASGERVSLPENEGMAGLLSDLHRHLGERGWLDRAIVHVADEPSFHNMGQWKAVAKFVREHMPGVETIDAIGATGYEDSLDIMVPLTRDVHTWFDDFKAAQDRGTELWFYTCCAPWGRYANRFLDYHLSKTRILHWMNYFTGTEGFLHWGLTYGWNDPFGPAPRFPPGDSHIIYPGKNGPMSSMRWEMLREGMEDYEYLWLLEERTREIMSRLNVSPDQFSPKTASREICGRLVGSLTDYTTDPEIFYAVRRFLAAELTKIREEPLVLLGTDPSPNTVLDTGPATTKVYGFVEPGTTVRVGGEEVPVDPATGQFVKKVGFSWSDRVLWVDVQKGDSRKTFRKEFTIH